MGNEIIANNLKDLRNINGLTQADLAKIAGVSDKTVSAWENCYSTPRNKPLSKIAIYFHIPIETFYKKNGIVPYAAEDLLSSISFHSGFYSGLQLMADALRQLDDQTRYSYILSLMLNGKDFSPLNNDPEVYRFLDKTQKQAHLLDDLFKYYYSLPEPFQKDFFEVTGKFYDQKNGSLFAVVMGFVKKYLIDNKAIDQINE